jgi:alpha-tubulin suppressor-like RCC1 family protein
MISSGKAFCWGNNTYGELGNNSTASSSVPVAVYTGGVLSGLTLTQITAGNGYTCALASTGAAYCWGYNVDGELGNGATLPGAQQDAPVAVSGSLVFAQISAGEYSVCALTTGNVGYCWGQNSSGQLGNGSTASTSKPVEEGPVNEVSIGGLFSCAISTAGGGTYCTGQGTSGQLGNGSAANSLSPVEVTGSSSYTQLDAGFNHTCALSSAGAVYCWGDNTYGEDGNNTVTTPEKTPVTVYTGGVMSGLTLTQISAGGEHTCALSSAGAAYCWGDDTYGELGNSTTSSVAGTYDAPVAVATSGALSGQTLTQVSAGQGFTCALDSTGIPYCWGNNASGQLGNGTTTSSDVPVAIVPGAPTGVTAFPAAASAVVDWVAPASFGIAGSTSGYTATASPGGASCTTTSLACTITGLTNGTTYTITVVTNTTAGNSSASTAATVTPWPPEAIAAGGRESSCTIYSGKAYCWGDDSDGELGNGVTTATAQLTPVAVYTGGVLAGLILTQITMGYWHVCALASTGAVYCWGLGTSGQLGNGGTSSSNVPVLVSGGLTFTQISAGQSSMCGVTSAGAVYCWGLGSSGQLGVSGSTASSSTPVAVTATGTALAGRTIVQVAAGYYHTCALDNTGLVYCWGIDTYGQLGNNTTSTTAQPAATAVYTTGTPMAGRTIVQITAGGQHTCALDSTGLAYCWGYGTNGQLGNNTTTSAQSVPVAVYTAGALAGVTLATISATEFHTCALGSTGLAFCWGYNADGRLGTNNTTATDVPAAVYTGGTLSGRTLAQVGAGDQDSCALDSAGIAYCWGNDGNGQLGNDSTAEANAAVLVGPQAPTNVTATPGSTTAAVSWTAPVFLNNGTLTGYTATTSPGAFTCTSTSATSCTITGLTSGATYTITLTTTATTGTSAPSTPASVTVLTGTLTNPVWSASSTTTGATGASYTYTFSTASTSTLSSVTMTVPAGTAGTAAVGTVTPASVAAGGTVALAGTTLTYTFTAVSISSGTAVSIQVTGLTNTSAPGSYTSVITTRTGTTTVDTATTAAVSFTGALANPLWSPSSSAPGATGVSYTYTFTTASTSTLTSVTMTVPAGTAGTAAVGTVTPAAVAAGGSVSLAGTTLTYTFTSVSVSSGTAVSIKITGLTNTSTTGSYTSVITTKNGGGTADSGTTPAVTIATGALASPAWSPSSTTTGTAGVSYTYTFTTASTSTLSSVTMTVPAGTAGTPVVGTVTPAAVAAGGSVSLAGTTLTYTFTSVSVSSGTAVSIQITGLKNTSASGSYTSVITTRNGGTAVDSGTTAAVIFTGALASPAWYVSSAALSATGVTYTYTFTTATTSTLSSVSMTVPAGTAGTPAVGTVTPASVATGGTVALAGGALTYTFTAVSVTSGTAVSIKITGLTNTSTTGSYSSVITTRNGSTAIDSGTSLPISFPGTVTLTSPASLTWSGALSGMNQQTVDTTAADQQLTVSDSTGTAAGWHVTASATTFTASSYTIPATGAMDVTGSVTTVASTAPSATCVGSCVLPTNTTTYPVLLNTAVSSPPPFTLYDTSSGTGVGQITLGGSTATYPIGWWMNVPANAHPGTYTSTVILTVVSGP